MFFKMLRVGAGVPVAMQASWQTLSSGMAIYSAFQLFYILRRRDANGCFVFLPACESRVSSLAWSGAGGGAARCCLCLGHSFLNLQPRGEVTNLLVTDNMATEEVAMKGLRHRGRMYCSFGSHRMQLYIAFVA